MENSEIIKVILERYEEAKATETSSVHYNLSKEKQTIFIKIGDKEYQITKNELSDTAEVGDELAEKIWNWVHR